MSIQAQLQRCRQVAGFTGAEVAPTQPVLGEGSSEPQIVMSPRTPTNLLTTGFAFFVQADTVSTISVWKRDPVSLWWALLITITPPQLATFKWLTVCDVNASELWFETDANVDGGTASVFLEEIGVSPAG